MKNDFLCPKCRGYLNIGENVVFTVKKSNGDAGLLFLSPELGNYTSVKHEKLHFEKDESVEIFCPVCHASLICKEGGHDLAQIIMKDQAGEELSILFSGIFGKESTYKIKGVEIKEKLGKDASRSLNFESLSFLK